MIYTSKSAEETAKIAIELALAIVGDETVLLSGELGAGKTTFVKALFKALGATDLVTSPTYTFMKEYRGRVPLYHFDMYRAESEAEVEELGLREFLGGGVSAIEWNKFEELTGNIINVDISRSDNGDRNIKIERMKL